MSIDSSVLTSVSILDATPQAAPQPQGGFEQTFIMLALALVFFYFIMWRPEKKRRKEMEEKRSSLKKGDTIVTTSGIMGTVDRIKQDTIIIKLEDNAKMEIIKGALQDIVTQSPSKSKEGEEEKNS